jgi:hypothetical protein
MGNNQLIRNANSSSKLMVGWRGAKSHHLFGDFRRRPEYSMEVMELTQFEVASVLAINFQQSSPG